MSFTVLPHEPSYLEMLVNRSAANLGQGYQRGADEQSKLHQLMMAAQAKGLMKQQEMQQKQQGLQQALVQKAQGLSSTLGIKPEEAMQIAAMPNEVVNQMLKEKYGLTSQQIKEKVDMEHSRERASAFYGTIDRMRELKPYVGTQWYGSKTMFLPLQRETIQRRAEYDSSIAHLLSFLKELDAKGQMPYKLIEKLEKKLPSSELSERENAGRLDALEGIVTRTLNRQYKQSENQSTKAFLYQGGKYNIPRDKIKEFLKDNPGAKPQ